MRFAILVAIAVLAHAARAHASCALRSWSSPNDGPVPLRGSVFSYSEAFQDKDPRIEWRDGRGTSTIVKVSPSVTRIDYEGTDGASLVVRPGFLDADEDNTYYTDTFTLSASASRFIPRLLSIKRQTGAWTCSSYDYLDIVLDAPAAALRARWTRYDGTFADYWVVGQGNRFDLGSVNCGGTTLPPGDMDDGGALTLTAILVDGSEHVIADDAWVFQTVPILHGWNAEDDDVPWGALVLSLVLVVLAARALYSPIGTTVLPTARVRVRSK